jgi:protease-4
MGRGAVGLVRIEGPIYDSAQVVKSLKSLRENPAIKAIVLRIDSPGGAVGASEEIYREAIRTKRDTGKPVLTSMGNAAASGGYYIAVASDEIFANGGTLTGSIGVIAMDFNVEQLLKTIGVRPVVVKSGEHKDTGSPFRDMAPEDRALLQSVIFDTYRQFVRTVLDARHDSIDRALADHPLEIADILSTSTTKRAEKPIEWEAFQSGTVAAEVGATTDAEVLLHTVADGRILSGEQALKLGLIDKIGTLEDVIQRAGELSGLGTKPIVIERKPRSGLPALLGVLGREFWREFARGNSEIEYRLPGH